MIREHRILRDEEDNICFQRDQEDSKSDEEDAGNELLKSEYKQTVLITGINSTFI